MKITNKEVSVKTGDKEYNFTNLILNNYLDLFADSFVNFKDKKLWYCFLSFTETNNNLNEKSTSMEYDVILETDTNKEIEILSAQSITNKYYYQKEISGKIQDYLGSTLKTIGFGTITSSGEYILYAYLDVMRYNIMVQENQPLIISRTDTVETDMQFWSSSNLIKAPLHLTKQGARIFQGINLTHFIPKLHSVGFGVLPYTLNKEYLVKDLTIEKTETGTLKVQDKITVDYLKALYFNENLKMSDSLLMQKPSYPFLIYKFKIYKRTPGLYPDFTPVDEETDKYYTQYTKLTKHSDLALKIKYERS